MEDNQDVKSQCIFCQIIDGKIPSRRVYEDDICVAILDINPANPGHVLILPKEHHPIMPLMPEADAAHMMQVAKKVSQAMIRGMKSQSTNIFAANGSAAGQKAPHFMIHVIPRNQGDGVTCFDLIKNDVMPEDQQKLMAAIGSKVAEQFGIATPHKAQEPEQNNSVEPLPDPDNHPADQENTSASFDIPEPHDDTYDSDEVEDKTKKKFDLDKIGGLFK